MIKGLFEELKERSIFPSFNEGKEVISLLKLLRIIFGLIALVFAIYGLISNKSILMPYMFMFFGAMYVTIGISEYQLKRKGACYINIIVSVFCFFASIKGFL